MGRLLCIFAGALVGLCHTYTRSSCLQGKNLTTSQEICHQDRDGVRSVYELCREIDRSLHEWDHPPQSQQHRQTCFQSIYTRLYETLQALEAYVARTPDASYAGSLIATIYRKELMCLYEGTISTGDIRQSLKEASCYMLHTLPDIVEDRYIAARDMLRDQYCENPEEQKKAFFLMTQYYEACQCYIDIYNIDDIKLPTLHNCGNFHQHDQEKQLDDMQETHKKLRQGYGYETYYQQTKGVFSHIQDACRRWKHVARLPENIKRIYNARPIKQIENTKCSHPLHILYRLSSWTATTCHRAQHMRYIGNYLPHNEIEAWKSICNDVCHNLRHAYTSMSYYQHQISMQYNCIDALWNRYTHHERKDVTERTSACGADMHASQQACQQAFGEYIFEQDSDLRLREIVGTIAHQYDKQVMSQNDIKSVQDKQYNTLSHTRMERVLTIIYGKIVRTKESRYAILSALSRRIWQERHSWSFWLRSWFTKHEPQHIRDLREKKETWNGIYTQRIYNLCTYVLPHVAHAQQWNQYKTWKQERCYQLLIAIYQELTQIQALAHISQE